MKLNTAPLGRQLIADVAVMGEHALAIRNLALDMGAAREGEPHLRRLHYAADILGSVAAAMMLLMNELQDGEGEPGLGDMFQLAKNLREAHGVAQVREAEGL